MYPTTQSNVPNSNKIIKVIFVTGYCQYHIDVGDIFRHSSPTSAAYTNTFSRCKQKLELFRTNPPDGKILLQSVEIIFEIAIEFLI